MTKLPSVSRQIAWTPEPSGPPVQAPGEPLSAHGDRDPKLKVTPGTSWNTLGARCGLSTAQKVQRSATHALAIRALMGEANDREWARLGGELSRSAQRVSWIMNILAEARKNGSAEEILPFLSESGWKGWHPKNPNDPAYEEEKWHHTLFSAAKLELHGRAGHSGRQIDIAGRQALARALSQRSRRQVARTEGEPHPALIQAYWNAQINWKEPGVKISRRYLSAQLVRDAKKASREPEAFLNRLRKLDMSRTDPAAGPARSPARNPDIDADAALRKLRAVVSQIHAIKLMQGSARSLREEASEALTAYLNSRSDDSAAFAPDDRHWSELRAELLRAYQSDAGVFGDLEAVVCGLHHLNSEATTALWGRPEAPPWSSRTVKLSEMSRVCLKLPIKPSVTLRRAVIEQAGYTLQVESELKHTTGSFCIEEAIQQLAEASERGLDRTIRRLVIEEIHLIARGLGLNVRDELRFWNLHVERLGPLLGADLALIARGAHRTHVHRLIPQAVAHLPQRTKRRGARATPVSAARQRQLDQLIQALEQPSLSASELWATDLRDLTLPEVNPEFKPGCAASALRCAVWVLGDSNPAQRLSWVSLSPGLQGSELLWLCWSLQHVATYRGSGPRQFNHSLETLLGLSAASDQAARRWGQMALTAEQRPKEAYEALMGEAMSAARGWSGLNYPKPREWIDPERMHTLALTTEAQTWFALACGAAVRLPGLHVQAAMNAITTGRTLSECALEAIREESGPQAKP